VQEFRTRRGFVEEITLRASRFLKHAAAIVSLAPVRELHLLNAKPHVPALAACRHLARIEQLQFDESNAALNAAAARALARSPYLDRLRELDLTGCRVGDSGFKALMASRSLPRLEVLDLYGNGVGNGMAEILPEARLRSLKSLNLGSNDVNDACMLGLANTESFPSLEELCLYHNELTAIGMWMLGRWPHARGLKKLNIHSNPLGDAGVEALATIVASAPMPSLCDLNLAGVGVKAAGLRALAAAPLAHLADLSLRSNKIGPKGAEALAQAPWLTGLSSLDVTSCAIGPAGLRHLLGVRGRWRPADLFLSDNKLDDACVSELVRSPLISELVFLDLDSNPLTSASAEALLASPYLTRLKFLSLPRRAGNARQKQALKERFAQAKVYFV
jgi:hypothetical protein